ncbi:uncharacterized protein SPAPADRAFT_139220 [Spathaspora passalidarum NRRL Y-27907]|uniref:Ribosome biogenesis protein NSA1 n=1 Tax=Spathaspora passalidarum (strain NRRL Y-27907 / 11-Y1) TaxID=619300 RepID=G3AQ01_SPAPN|nr:uncharacterized protein SPAPADRAFT_139220 [Spathaspora passalidarum NRRL Y-27907]EGW32322.1 hypothetical protein SPAPADRAFT_139220 [Spathaspora passalidarum NRRL Y-27907]
MDLLLSTQDRGSIRVVRLSKKTSDSLDISIKHEFCIGGRENYIQKILNFKFQHKPHMIIARKNGLIQLYKKTTDDDGSSYYQLCKEWKNSQLNIHDTIVSVGFLNQQYLYSCSRDGKLIIRDLINDDADEGYKVYLIQSPVADIAMKMKNNITMQVVSCGKNNDVKAYEISMDSRSSKSPSPPMTTYPLSIDLRYISLRNQPLRRSLTSLNLRDEYTPPTRGGSGSPNSDRQVSTLSPIWSSLTHYSDYVYNAHSLEKISNWIVSVAIMGTNILCGSQFGKLVLYNLASDGYPITTLTLSQFPILNLKPISDDLLMYSDSMCKVGILRVSLMKIVLQYDDLKIGPMSHFQYILPGSIGTSTTKGHRRKISGGVKFDPMYVLATTFDKRMVIYKLFDNSRSELLLDCKLGDSLIPSVSLLNKNRSDYEMIHSIFGNDDELSDSSGLDEELVITKKRRLSVIREKYDNRIGELETPKKPKQQFVNMSRHGSIEEELAEGDSELLEGISTRTSKTTHEHNECDEIHDVEFK